MIFKRQRFPESYPADLRPMIEALKHRDGGHCSQKKNESPRPAPDRAITLMLMNGLESSNVFVSGRTVHGNTNSTSPSGAKWRSTSASSTLTSVAGRQRGVLSL